jgi:hypothetical protein
MYPTKCQSFLLEDMHIIDLYNISKIQVERRPEATKICFMFWTYLAHSLIILFIFQSISCLFMHRSYYNMFPDVSYLFPKGFPKIHHNKPRNTSGVRTAVGRVFHVLTPLPIYHLGDYTSQSSCSTFLRILEFKPCTHPLICHWTCESFLRCLRTSHIE